MSTIEERGKWLTYGTIAMALLGAVCNLFAEMNSSDMAKIHDDMVAFQFEPSSIRQYLFLGLCGVVTFACTSYNRCLRSGLVHEGELVRSIGIVLGIVSPLARLSTPPVTVSEELRTFYERLERHNWQAGLTWPPEPQHIVDMAQAEFEALDMTAKTSEQHQRLMDAFLEYEFSGDPFTDQVLPKPILVSNEGLLNLSALR